MAGMKVTLSAAMRARDVSRPREEQFTEATYEDPAVTDTGGDAHPQRSGDELPQRSAGQPQQRRRHHR